MPKTKIQEYDASAGANTDIAGVNIDEGWSPANVNDSIRALMGHIKTALSGSDDSLITGTAGGTNTLGGFNADGDLVDASAFDFTVTGSPNLRKLVSVDNEGAVGDGVTDDTTAFNAAITALPTAGGVILLSDNKNYIVTVGSLTPGAKKIVWAGEGRVNGAALTTLPGIQDTFDATLGRYLYNKEDAAALDGSYKDNRRNANYSGGSGGDLDYIETWHTTIASTVGSSGNRKAEKAGLFKITHQSDHANGIALFAATFAEAQGAAWAIESSTHSEVTPATYAHRSLEANIHGYGVDTNNLRWIANFSPHNETQVYSGTPGTDEVGVAVEIYPDTADLNYGIRIRTLSGAGTTRGVVQEAAIRVDISEGELFEGFSGSDTAHIKIGSDLDTATDIVAQITGQGHDSASNITSYTQIRSVIIDPTNGAEDGALQFYGSAAGSLARLMSLNGGVDDALSIYVDGALQQVTAGISNSGGTGFRLLRVAN